jgi:hypothetical protein
VSEEKLMKTRSMDAIGADFRKLSGADFAPADGCTLSWSRLNSLCDELRALNDPAEGVPILFNALLRLDNDLLGDPGPIVHTLESWPGQYEAMLANSVHRRPVRLCLWMVNRLLNSNPPNADVWLELLRGVTDRVDVSSDMKTLAAEFLEFQSQRQDR